MRRNCFSSDILALSLCVVLVIVLTILAPPVNGASTEPTAQASPDRSISQDEEVSQSSCVADINRDGKDEIICGDGGNTLRCFNCDGTLRWAVDLGSRVGSSAAEWDVNDDGLMEIFVGSRSGYVWGLDATGRVLPEWGWPKPMFIFFISPEDVSVILHFVVHT